MPEATTPVETTAGAQSFRPTTGVGAAVPDEDDAAPEDDASFVAGENAAPTRDEGDGGTVWRALLDGRVPPAEVARGGEGAELLARYGPLVAAGPRLVLAQLGQSLDGFVAARTGDARHVTGEEDRRHLHRLRALVDAVVVGVSTVAADDCLLTVRSVGGPSPVRVVLDPRARAPRTARLLAEGPPVLWCVAGGADEPALPPHVEVVSLPAPSGAFAPADVLAALAARGLGRVLVEGGGRTVSAFLAAGVLDRLLVTTAPLLVGDGVPGLRFAGADRLADALRPPARRFALGEDSCLELDLAAARAARHP
ncbi:RibD family protein [uncultured Pseudokineococcus sp.]|uniref:RibD family protein n=1 Tax=uncultured Pseudokineococcus sp. TaxID=1642928 RepID=UPI002613E71D|nr:RibD family protein [uncultured Pseudokineococcus sp.]